MNQENKSTRDDNESEGERENWPVSFISLWLAKSKTNASGI